MAITQVRAKLEGQWVTLTYNASTARWEGNLSPTGSSRHEPGGYFPVTVELTNATGKTETVSGTALKSLRLVVLEAEAPTLALVSPAAGYVTTASPVFLLTAQDEEGGSGVDPGTIQVTLDGAPLANTATESGGVYTITAPASDLAEGPHSLAVTVSDHDGNLAELSAAYTVDTVPPELWVETPEGHAVTDDESVRIVGRAADRTAPPVTVTVAGEAAALTAGRFDVTVPLAVGENTIQVKAVDAAGLETVREVYRIRLVTDRGPADLEALRALLAKPLDQWTAAETARFIQGVERGAYNASDLNRVGVAAGYLAGWLTEYGYAVDVAAKTDWAQGDIPRVNQGERYLRNIASIRGALPVEAPGFPLDLDGLTLGEANDSAGVVGGVAALRTPMEQSFIYAGEAFAGEF